VPAALVAVVVAASCTASPAGSGGGPEGGEPPAATGASAHEPRADLDIRLVGLRASPVGKGHVPPKDLSEPAEAVRRSIEGLYRTAFLQPGRWEEGDYTALLSHFAGTARERVMTDLNVLTIGAAASEVDEVRPTRAILRLELLLDAHDRAYGAFAETEFEATAVAGDTEGPILHRAHYVLRRTNGAWRVVSYKVRGRIPRPAQDRVETAEVAFAPGLPSSGPLFILVIGSDARPGQMVGRTRADSIHIVGVDPRSGRGTVFGIPRDSWVPIPGWGTDKINAALVRGGPELLVDTVEHVSGVQMDGYVLTGFRGFEEMVDAIGGIRVNIPYPIHDVLARARFERGPRMLNGANALAFSRARHDVPRGDFSRSFNQGRVLVAALTTLREQAGRAPALLAPWVAAGARILRTNLALDDLFELALAATTLEPSKIRNVVASGHTGTIAGKSVVVLDGSAHAAFRDLARDGVLNP
jgi:LCP family protein required for cell wall assembly